MKTIGQKLAKSYIPLLWLGLLMPLAVQGQAQVPASIYQSPKLQWSSGQSQNKWSKLPSTQLQFPKPSSSSQLSSHWLPEYARQNPAGHAYLCQKEVEWENRLPVGIWIEAENDGPLQDQLMSGVRLRLRTFLTKR